MKKNNEVLGENECMKNIMELIVTRYLGIQQ